MGQPRDRTPLAQTTERIVDKVMDLAPSLLACGEKACVVIATDGKPTDGENAFQRAVERLPIQAAGVSGLPPVHQ